MREDHFRLRPRKLPAGSTDLVRKPASHRTQVQGQTSPNVGLQVWLPLPSRCHLLTQPKLPKLVFVPKAMARLQDMKSASSFLPFKVRIQILLSTRTPFHNQNRMLLKKKKDLFVYLGLLGHSGFSIFVAACELVIVACGT